MDRKTILGAMAVMALGGGMASLMEPGLRGTHSRERMPKGLSGKKHRHKPFKGSKAAKKAARQHKK